MCGFLYESMGVAPEPNFSTFHRYSLAHPTLIIFSCFNFNEKVASSLVLGLISKPSQTTSDY